jgi:hypothetical protein
MSTYAGNVALPNLTARPQQVEAWLRAPAAPSRSRVLLGVVIWTPAVLAALVCLYLNQNVPAAMALCLALLVHTVLRPIVALYVLVASIPLDWTVVVLPDVAQLSKLLGIFAMLVSIPRLFGLAVPTRWDRSGRWMAALIVWGACGITWAAFTPSTVSGVLSLALRWGMAVLICVHCTDRQTLRTLKLVFMTACVASSFVYLFHSDMRSVLESQARTELALGSTESGGNLNEQARTLGIALFIAVLELMERRRLLTRLLLLGALFVLVVAIILLKGRAVYLGIPFAIVMASILLGGVGLSRRLGFLLIAGFLGGLLGLAVVKLGFFGEGVTARFNSIFSEGTESGGRAYYWQQHVKALIETGLIGTGLDQMVYRPGSGFRVAHNDWFSIAGEFGLPGLMCFAMFHLSLFLRMRLIPDVRDKLFCLVCWTFMCFVGLTQDDYPLKWYVVTAGIIIATLHLHERSPGGVPSALPRLRA